jgi:hypothetical protein
MMRRSILFLSVLVTFVATRALAQEGPEHLDPFPHGAGRTYSVTGRGFEGALLNPAVLAIPGDRMFEFSVFPATAFGAKLGASFSDLNTIANADMANDTSRGNMMSLLFNNKLSGSANARVFGICFTKEGLGSIAFNWTTHAGLKTILGDSLLRFFGQNAVANLSQNALTHSTTDVAAQWYSEYTLSFGRTLIGGDSSGDFEVSAGAGVKLVSGVGYARLDPSSYISIDPVGGANILTAHYKLQLAYPDALATNDLPSGFSLGLLTTNTAGRGFGFDLGVLLGPHARDGEDPAYRIGLSITDIGSISWDQHTDVRTLDTSITINPSLPSDTVRKILNSLAGHLDTTGHPFSTSLPTTLHMGAVMGLQGLGIAPAGLQLSGAAEFAVGLADIVTAPTKGRLGISAILQRPSPTFSFRTALGVVTELGVTDLTFAVGIGIRNTVMVDFGTAGLLGLFQSDSPTDAALSIRILL